MPSQFKNRGDGSLPNGVVVLALLASLLVYVYHAELTHLIQLYVVGVFTAFTLSQLGMVRHWIKGHAEGWSGPMINGVGVTTTGVVLVIVIMSKFSKGAWIVIVTIPFIVAFFLACIATTNGWRGCYRSDGRARTQPHDESVHRAGSGSRTCDGDAIAHLRSTRPERVTPLYVGPPGTFEEMLDPMDLGCAAFGRARAASAAEEHLPRACADICRRWRHPRKSSSPWCCPRWCRARPGGNCCGSERISG